MYVSLHVKYLLPLSDFNKTLIFSTGFRKILKYISWKSFLWEPSFPIRMDRQTDTSKLIVALRNFAKAPKNKNKKFSQIFHQHPSALPPSWSQSSSLCIFLWPPSTACALYQPSSPTHCSQTLYANITSVKDTKFDTRTKHQVKLYFRKSNKEPPN